MATAQARENVLGMYRRLLKLAKMAKPSDSQNMIMQIRQKFRENKEISDPATIIDLLKSANSSLGYIRMVTPRMPSPNIESRISKVVMGEKTQTGRMAHTNWHGGNLDPDSVRRHNASLKRCGFQNNAHAKGIF